jgi:hypothetical protein
MLVQFDGVLARDEKSSWIYVRWAESKEVLGTGKPVRVRVSVDGHDFETTPMPLGDGAHMIPIKASVRKALRKELGDAVSIGIVTRIQ